MEWEIIMKEGRLRQDLDFKTNMDAQGESFMNRKGPAGVGGARGDGD